MLNEYALRFYTFLEVSIQLDAQQWLEQATAASVPYMDDSERKQLLDTYKQTSRDIIEDIREAFQTRGIDELKEQFNG